MVGLLATNQHSIVCFCQFRNQSHLDNHKRLGYWNCSLTNGKDCNRTVLLTLHENIPKLLTRITTRYTVHTGALSRWKIAAEQWYHSVQFTPWVTSIFLEHRQATYSLYHKNTVAEIKGTLPTAVSSRLGAHLPFPHLPQVHRGSITELANSTSNPVSKADWACSVWPHSRASNAVVVCSDYSFTASLLWSWNWQFPVMWTTVRRLYVMATFAFLLLFL